MQRGKQAIPDETRMLIFRELVKIRKPSERWGLESRLADQFNVSRTTIRRIYRDEKLLNRWLAEGNLAFNVAMGQVQRLATDALSVQAEYIENEDLPVEQQYLRQNAAVDIMNRANLRHKDKEDNTHRIVFEGMGVPVGMPPTEGRQEE